MAPQDPVPVYHRAELLVLPSLHDGFGFVVAEAMACGLPVIVTTSTGAAEWVTPDCGWIVPPADSDSLIAALTDAMSRRTELTNMGRRARAAVLNQIVQRSLCQPFFDASERVKAIRNLGRGSPREHHQMLTRLPPSETAGSHTPRALN